MSHPSPLPGEALPDRRHLAGLLEAERTLAFQRITPAWAHFLTAVAAAAGIWLPAEGAARAVAVAAVLLPGLHLLLRAKALTETVIVFRDDEDGDGAGSGSGSGSAVTPAGKSRDDEAEPEVDDATIGRIAGRAVVVTGALVCVVLALAIALLPLTWLRVALPGLCLWFLYDLYRSHRRRAEARVVVARAATEPWYPAYRRLIEERRASLK
ncbi:hypothetical protein [Streptomyces sp. NPDC012888]|uniref:hypothetical protein n=1 Tax=Streptomyces sp. NPDC012888 TaxID=3364855 RepID=UPI0036C350E9